MIYLPVMSKDADESINEDMAHHKVLLYTLVVTPRFFAQHFVGVCVYVCMRAVECAAVWSTCRDIST